MLYSINIGVYNTWNDFYLLPTSRPLVNPPETRFKMVEIPGRNGALDLTDIYSDNGEPVLGTRKGSWEFAVINKNISVSGLEDYEEAGRDFYNRKWKTELEKNIPDENSRSWTYIYSTLMQRIHGKNQVVSLSDDPDYSYFGRMSVNEWRSDEKYSLITLDYEFQPFRFPNKEGLDPQLASISRSEGGLL